MRKPVLNLHQKALLTSLACAAALPAPTVFAGPGGETTTTTYYGSSIVEIEMIRRQRAFLDALELEREGDRLSARQDFGGAIERYEAALIKMPNGVSTQNDRWRIIQKYCRNGVIHARELGHRGEFDKANTLLSKILAENMDPHCTEAIRLQTQLGDPDRFNQAMTPQHYEKTEEVKRHFQKALGYYDLGDFKHAEDEFNRILAIDPYNTAARRGLERTEREISNYLKSARDHARLKMLNEVDNLWAISVPGIIKAPANVIGAEVGDPGSAGLTFKLNNITIERLQFAEADLNEVVSYLRRKSVEADNIETDPNKKGVNILNKVPDGSAKSVSLDMRNVKLLDAIKAATELAGVRFDVQPNAVVFIPGGTGPVGTMTQRTFRVPPDFLSKGGAAGGEAGGAAAPADPFAAGGAEAPAGPRLAGRKNAKEVLISLGVTFPEGASASFDAGSTRLIVRNTYDQLDLIETLVEGMVNTTKQVYITTKFVEVTQRNTDELGFDWLLGAFNIGGDRVFGSGGTSGNAGPMDPTDYPVVAPGGNPVGGNPITRGLRFGGDAISRNAIDSLIAGGAAEGVSAVTPAAFALAGVFTDPQFQLVMRALSQKKGVDLMTAPSIIVRGGQRSKIEVIREFPYPTEFDPPQIPQTFGGGATLNGLGAAQQGSSFPVTPTTPSSFTFKNTGVTMEVEATVGDDGYTIDLNLAPEVIEFEGFINYGSPIQTTGINALGQNEPVVLTENKILQPVFATRKLQTQVLIYDRQTVGIGGLIREDVQHVEDKVPILSSIPLVGRLFKTKNEEHFKKNLMIYVTATLIGPDGQPLHMTQDIEVQPTEPPNEILPPIEGIPVDHGK